MRAVTAFAIASTALVGCSLYSGDATDDDDPPIPEGALAPATPRFANALVVEAYDDARFLVMQHDIESGQILLLRHDVRDHSTVELDRMPIGSGAAQILVARQTIGWGFRGVGHDAGTFRLVDTNGPRALDFAGHAPSVLLGHWPDPPSLTYASTADCTIERLDLASGAIEVRRQISCFSEFEAVILDEFLAIWIRVADQDWQRSGIGMIDGLWPGDIGFARLGAETLGPFTSPGHYWFVDQNFDNANASLLRGANGQGPVPPAPEFYADLDGGPETLALVGDTPWFATSAPTYLVPVEPGGATVRYPIDYRPIRMIGLSNRVIALVDDGTVLEQPLDPL